MTTRRPAWKLLPMIVALMGALLAAVERLPVPPAIRTILQARGDVAATTSPSLLRAARLK